LVRGAHVEGLVSLRGQVEGRARALTRGTRRGDGLSCTDVCIVCPTRSHPLQLPRPALVRRSLLPALPPPQASSHSLAVHHASLSMLCISCASWHSALPRGTPACFSVITVAENLEIGCYPLRTSSAGAGIGRRSRCDIRALSPFLHQRRGQASLPLSGGEQQMAGRSRGADSKPQLVAVRESPRLGLCGPRWSERTFEIIKEEKDIRIRVASQVDPRGAERVRRGWSSPKLAPTWSGAWARVAVRHRCEAARQPARLRAHLCGVSRLPRCNFTTATPPRQIGTWGFARSLLMDWPL